MPLTHSLTRRAYWRVDRCPSRPRRPGNQALTELSPADPKVVVNCLPGRFGEFEANRPAGLALPDIGAVNCVAIGRHVFDIERNKIAAAQFAIDGEIEQRQIPHAPLQLQPGTYGPDMADTQRWLRAAEFAFGARRSAPT
jgi:hypothetical protein